MTKPWKTLSSKIVFENKWMKLRMDKVINPSGEESEFSLIEKDDYGLVIPKVQDKFYLVNEYRLTVEARSWAFPQGHFEVGVDKSPEENAIRELKEETGLIARKLQFLSKLYLAPGFCTQQFSVYLADDCQQEKSKRDLTELDMRVGAFSEKEIAKMIKEGEIKDSPTVAAFGLYLLQQK